MPVYDTIIPYHSGFYNSKKVNGIDDRVYTAEDVRKPYDTVFSDGVLPAEDGTAGDNLKVSVVGGMKIKVAAGHAKLGGAWFENTADFNITLDAAGNATRYDCVIIRNDDNENTRAASIYIKSLTTPPAVSNLTRSGGIYELCIAYVVVNSGVTSISNTYIKDMRMHGTLCQTMTGVGAVVTRTYRNTVYTTAEDQKNITIGISQFDSSKDVLTVYIEGRTLSPANYTINTNGTITLALGLPVVGTKIDFEVVKNINGAASADATGEYLALLGDVTAHNKKLEHHYYCNGANDNINISQLASGFISAGTDYSSMRLVIHGTFGAAAAHSGTGTDGDPYIWIRAGAGGATNRRVYLDFTDCSAITINVPENSYNTIFFGLHCDIIGANITAYGGAQITMFSRVASTISNAEKCRFWITSKTGYISRGGTFRDCRVSLTTTAENSCAFNVLKNGLLRLFGGEYYAYAPTGYWSAVVYVNAAQTDSTKGAIVNTYSINCPTVARSSYVQTYAVNCLTGDARCSFTDTISNLEIVAEGQNIRGTIKANIAGTI